MRMANLDGRAVLIGSDGTVTDVASASDGRFGPDPAQLIAEWDGFAAWARTAAIDKVARGLFNWGRRLRRRSSHPRTLPGS